MYIIFLTMDDIFFKYLYTNGSSEDKFYFKPENSLAVAE